MSPLKNRRILALASAIGRSHLTRLILIARELRKIGAEVAFAYRDSQNELLRREGFRVYPITDVHITDFSRNVYEAFTPTLVEQAVRDELKAIEAFHPDLLLSDFRHTAAISARLAQLNHVSVVNAVMTNLFNPARVMSAAPISSTRFKFTSGITQWIQDRQKRTLARPWREVARRHGIKDLNSLYDFLAGNLTLIADLPQYCPLPGIPENFRYVGPLIWEEPDEPPAPLPEPGPDQTLIYATTGNTGGIRLAEWVVEVLGNDPAYQVVLTTGAFLDPRAVPAAPNVHIRRFLPASQILPRVRAAIHCGGSGTTYQALLQGVPALVIPFNNEQRLNGWLIMRHNLGIPLSPVELTPEKIRLNLEKLLADQQIRQTVQQFTQGWQKDEGPKVATLRIGMFWAGIESAASRNS